MRNIFLFIRRYFNFLFFVMLQILALSLLFHYNKFHEAAFMKVANEVTGSVGEKYDNIDYYFHLKKTNEDLVRKNEELLNRLKENWEAPDTTQKLVRDTIPYDTLGNYHKYAWKAAKVVNGTVSLQNNYITIHRGEKQGVTNEMGVVSNEGVVGIIINTSENFAVVMTMLHRQFRLSASLKKSGETGSVLWDGESPFYLTMINVPKNVEVVKGDTIVTSQYSAYRFPPGILVGTVSEITTDKGSNFYTLRLKPATNFYSLEYVYVVENTQREEQKKLEEDTKKIK